MNAGVGVNEDALGGEALGAVAGNGIAVVEMRMLAGVEFDLAVIAKACGDAAIGMDRFDDGKVAIRNAERFVGCGELDTLACGADVHVAGGGGHGEETAPDGEAGQRVVDLGLGEQALRVGDFGDVAEAGLIARGRLPSRRCAPLPPATGVLAAMRRAPFSVATARFHWARRSVAICCGPGLLRADGGGLRGLAGA